MEDNGVKMVSEPAVAYSSASYADVMEYIHSLHISHADKERVAKRLALEVSQPALSAAYERVDHLVGYFTQDYQEYQIGTSVI